MEFYSFKTGSGSTNKHVPVVTINDNKVIVEVGVEEHPMTEEHLIEWIAIETTKGIQVAKLSYTDKPKAEFTLADGAEFISAYENCNLHGLWKK